MRRKSKRFTLFQKGGNYHLAGSQPVPFLAILSFNSTGCASDLLKDWIPLQRAGGGETHCERVEVKSYCMTAR